MGVHELGAAGGDVRTRGDDARRHRSIHREDLILLRFLDEHRLQFLHPVRILGGEVLGLAEILVQVVELEHLVVEWIGIGRAKGFPGCAVHLGAQQPAFVIQRPLAEHLEILGFVPGGRLGVLRVKGVGEAYALDRRLFDAVHRLGSIDAGDLQQGGHDIDDMHELLAQAALVLDSLRPGDHHALPHTAEPRGVLFEPGERRVKGPGPARRHVVVGLLRTPHVVPLHLYVHRHHVDAVEERDFVGCAERATFGAGAVVAVDVDDKRVVEFAHIVDGLDDTADFVVVVRLVGGEDFHLADEKLLLLRRQIIPVLDEVGRPGFQLGIRRNHAEALLVFENPFA